MNPPLPGNGAALHVRPHSLQTNSGPVPEFAPDVLADTTAWTGQASHLQKPSLTLTSAARAGLMRRLLEHDYWTNGECWIQNDTGCPCVADELIDCGPGSACIDDGFLFVPCDDASAIHDNPLADVWVFDCLIANRDGNPDEAPPGCASRG